MRAFPELHSPSLIYETDIMRRLIVEGLNCDEKKEGVLERWNDTEREGEKERGRDGARDNFAICRNWMHCMLR